MKNSPHSLIARYSATQALTEVALGSIVHAMQIPLGGHLLSLNQGFLHTLALKRIGARREGVSSISAIASAVAVLKGLSPAGKRLTPMLAISVQGLLYAMGVGVGGANFAGATLGSVLLSLWGFAQPILIAYLFFGSSLFEGILKIWNEIAGRFALDARGLVWILGGIVALKCIAATTCAWIAWRASPALATDYLSRLEAASRRTLPRAPMASPFAGALRDLLNPLFLIGTGLSAGFLYFSNQAGAPQVALYFLRVLAVALLFFWAMRALPRTWILRALQPFPRVREAVQAVQVVLAERMDLR